MRCVKGAIHDVIVDLRPGSPSYGRWQGFELTAENGRMLYVPAGFAHGFQTLPDDTDVTYRSRTATPRAPRAACAGTTRGLGIAWPLPVAVISEKDAAWPDVDLAVGVPV